jgi:hypothetical protein
MSNKALKINGWSLTTIILKIDYTLSASTSNYSILVFV